MKIQLYRHAVTLNNLGVHLLAQGASKQAFETLRDAVDTLRVSCNPSFAEHDLAQRNVSSDSLTKIQKANTKVSNLIRTGKLKTIELHCWEDLDISMSRSLSMAPASLGDECRVAFSMSTNVDIVQRDRELDSSLILYNYALAHLALSTEENATQVNASALSLLRMSFSILFRKIEEEIDEEYWGVESSVESVTGLTIAVLSNLAHTLVFQGRAVEARSCHRRLGDIVQALSAVDEIQAVYSMRSTAAAAA